MTIANLNDMIITAHINQTDVIRLQPGQEVDVQVESVPGLRMKGKMERIAPQAILKNGIKGFTTRVQIKEIDPRVRPGMTAILTIPVASADDVLSVPLAAVHTDRSGDRFVYVRQGDEFVPRAVTLGIMDYNYAEVQEGLAEGDIVSLERVADPTIANVRKTRATANRLTGTGARADESPAASPSTAGRPARQGAERIPVRASGS